MTIQNKLDSLKTALLSVTDAVYHVRACQTMPPYLVWTEDGAGECLHANGVVLEQPFTGTIDLFERETTTQHYAPLVQKALQQLDGCAWYLNSIQYEQDTGLVHYEWVWELC